MSRLSDKTSSGEIRLEVYELTVTGPTFLNGLVTVNSNTIINGNLLVTGTINGGSLVGVVTAVTASAPLNSTGGVIPNISLTAGSANQVLTTIGGIPTWSNPAPSGVTSVALTTPSFLTVTGSPINSSGTLAIAYNPGTALPTTSGGTGITTVGTVGQVLSSNGTTLGWVTLGTGGTVTSFSVAAVPTFLTSSVATASSTPTLTLSLSGTALPITSGGTGLITTGFQNAVLTSNGTTNFWGPVGSLAGETRNYMQYLTSTPILTGTQTKFQGCSTISSGNSRFALLSGGNTTGTVSVANISDPLNPYFTGSLTLAGSYGVVPGTWPLCYVPSSGGQNLYVVDLTNPFLPTQKTFVKVVATGAVYNLTLVYPYAYCATQSYGMYVVDVSTVPPTVVFQETLVNNTVAKCSSTTIDSRGNLYSNDYLSYTTVGPKLKTWSISTPSTPSLTATNTYPAYINNQPERIVAVGTRLYMTTNSVTFGYVLIFDITTPTTPTISSAIQYNGGFQLGASLSFSNNYMYVPAGSATVNRTSPATTASAIDLYDVTSITNPIKIASMTSGILNDVLFGGTIFEGFMYVADYGIAPGANGALQIFSCAQENSYIAKTSTGSISLNSTSQRIGFVTLIGGTATISNTTVDSNSYIFMTVKAAGGTQGLLGYTIVPGVSFTITSTSVTDTSTIAYLIVESI